ncbi:MAG: SIMPL domain-containing protein [Moraxella sp.]|nr:SIMPL domain-containing protein [Moraxella sp.]
MLKKTAAALAMMAMSATAYANVNAAETSVKSGNLVSFEVATQKQVANDEAVAVMNKTVTAKDAKTLASRLNPIINQALTLAKKYPSVTVSTGRQHTYPSYDNKGVITGMTGSANINLKSQDTESLSALVGELQAIMTIENLDFNVSDALREQTQSDLMLDATQKFKRQADTLTQAWGARSYRLVEAQMNTSMSYHTRGAMVMPMLASPASDASAKEQSFEAGESEVRYTINGTIQLVY